MADLASLLKRLANTTDHDEALRLSKAIARAQGKRAVKTDWSQGTNGVNEVRGELNYKHRVARARNLASTIGNRTTASSKQRATNRLLANFGYTTGASGTSVNPSRKPNLSGALAQVPFKTPTVGSGQTGKRRTGKRRGRGTLVGRRAA